ncbi:hypothetical protein [Listeria booriae]|uniref:hypothetical protein n=1 Tax=Listeria booriae TaxID=1552123 RepID=UPI0016279556|nr:hypothetical protein [Listeria booriae]MBC2100598.1 hypothetical protein [Listeria booriae]MBC2392243.1 hypothetical protein [Listeria booriae]
MKKIEEVKFEEAKTLVHQLQDIAIFNKNIKVVAIVTNIVDEKNSPTITTINGDQESLIQLYAHLTVDLTSRLFEDHTCPCIPETIEEAAQKGISMGIQEVLKKKASE